MAGKSAGEVGRSTNIREKDRTYDGLPPKPVSEPNILLLRNLDLSHLTPLVKHNDYQIFLKFRQVFIKIGANDYELDQTKCFLWEKTLKSSWCLQKKEEKAAKRIVRPLS